MDFDKEYSDHKLGLNKRIQKRYSEDISDDPTASVYQIDFDNFKSIVDKACKDLLVGKKFWVKRFDINSKGRTLLGIGSRSWYWNKKDCLQMSLFILKKSWLEERIGLTVKEEVDGNITPKYMRDFYNFVGNDPEYAIYAVIKTNGTEAFEFEKVASIDQAFTKEEMIPLEAAKHLKLKDSANRAIAYCLDATASNIYLVLRMCFNSISRFVNIFKNDYWLNDELDESLNDELNVELNETNLGLNKHVQKKFEEKDAIDNISDYVDLGLPSGNLWCKHNYGVTSEEEYGEYYTFDDAQKLDILIPSKSDFIEMSVNCDHKWTKVNNVPGMLFTSKINGGTVFFPAAGVYKVSKSKVKSIVTYNEEFGYYWSSTEETSTYGYDMFFYDNSVISHHSSVRGNYRFPIRPILKTIKESDLGLNKRVQKKFEEKDTIDTVSYDKYYKVLFKMVQWYAWLTYSDLKHSIERVLVILGKQLKPYPKEAPSPGFMYSSVNKCFMISLGEYGATDSELVFNKDSLYSANLMNKYTETKKGKAYKDVSNVISFFSQFVVEVGTTYYQEILDFLDQMIEKTRDSSYELEMKKILMESSLGLNKHIQNKFGSRDSIESITPSIDDLESAEDCLNSLLKTYKFKQVENIVGTTEVIKPSGKHTYDYLRLSVQHSVYEIKTSHHISDFWIINIYDKGCEKRFKDKVTFDITYSSNNPHHSHFLTPTEVIGEYDLPPKKIWIASYEKFLSIIRYCAEDKEVINEANLGLNKHVQKKFKDTDAVESISEYVDLGLPSGTLWCKHNYGGDEEHDYGDYFPFDYALKIENVPSSADFEELYSNCSHSLKKVNGVNGMEFTSLSNRKSIFFPMSGGYFGGSLYDQNGLGMYWTSTSRDEEEGYEFYFDDYNEVDPIGYNDRTNEFPIRTILKKTDEANLGLNKHVQKKFQDVDAVDNISEYVDLGLPSGTLWCSHNYGAESEEEFGDYYDFYLAQRLGDDKVPSMEDFKELDKFCAHEWCERHGVKGMLFTSRKNGKTLFFPAAGVSTSTNAKIYHGDNGFYWSSSESKDDSGHNMYFSSELVFPNDSTKTYHHLPVRTVLRKIEESNLGLNKHVQKKFNSVDTEEYSEEVGEMTHEVLNSEKFAEALFNDALRRGIYADAGKLMKSNIDKEDYIRQNYLYNYTLYGKVKNPDSRPNSDNYRDNWEVHDKILITPYYVCAWPHWTYKTIVVNCIIGGDIFNYRDDLLVVIDLNDDYTAISRITFGKVDVDNWETDYGPLHTLDLKSLFGDLVEMNPDGTYKLTKQNAMLIISLFNTFFKHKYDTVKTRKTSREYRLSRITGEVNPKTRFELVDVPLWKKLVKMNTKRSNGPICKMIYDIWKKESKNGSL